MAWSGTRTTNGCRGPTCCLRPMPDRRRSTPATCFSMNSRWRSTSCRRSSARCLLRTSWRGADRKSTRLNSSHSQISYAVFCLKKKTVAFDATKFSVNTDIEALISENLGWHQRQVALSRAFPQKGISVIVKAPSAENAELATNALAQRLSENPNLFPLVGQPDSGDFFERNGLLFGSPAEV